MVPSHAIWAGHSKPGSCLVWILVSRSTYFKIFCVLPGDWDQLGLAVLSRQGALSPCLCFSPCRELSISLSQAWGLPDAPRALRLKLIGLPQGPGWFLVQEHSMVSGPHLLTKVVFVSWDCIRWGYQDGTDMLILSESQSHRT